MLFTSDYLETDPKKKDHEWLRSIITQFRMGDYQPLYSAELAKKHREIINSDQSMEDIEKMFKDPEKMKTNGFKFLKVCVIEKIKNILCGEKWKAEIKAYVDAKDPSLQRLKKEDKNLLKQKKVIDGAVNGLKKNLGLPPEKINNDDFNGNYDDFESMGFDESDNGDIETFFETFHQLDTESDFQKIINHTFAVNAIEESTYEYVVDLMATKTMACQIFVNKITGQITWRRIAPERVWVIRGDRKINQKSSVAVGYYESVTVNEFLKRAGTNFNMLTQFEILLMGVNSQNKTNFGGVEIDGVILGDKDNFCNYSTLMNYTVELGYCTFKSIDSDKYKVYKNRMGNTKAYEIDSTRPVNDKHEYTTVEDFRERTYEAWFLSTGLTDTFVFEGGLLYHQETEGQEDEISNFPIKYIQYGGKTVAEVSEPWLEMAQEGFTKFRFLLRDAKKDGRSYNIDSMIGVAAKFFGKDAGPAGIKALIEMFKDSADELYEYPRDPQGNPVAIQGGVNHPKQNDFDVKLKVFKEIIEWCVEMIKNDIGINDLREGANQKTNDVYKLQQAALEQSSNATYYMDNMFDWTYVNSAISILALSQDGIRFKTSLLYKYIKNIVGEEGCKRLHALPKIAAHRMEIFVSSFANIKDRIKVLSDTEQAFQKGAIDYATKVLIDNTNDHRKAQKLLVIKEQKAIKLDQKQKQQDQQFAMNLQKQKTQDELAIIDRRGGWEVKKTQVQADGFLRASQVQVAGKGEVQDKKEAADQENEILKHNLKEQQSLGIN